MKDHHEFYSSRSTLSDDVGRQRTQHQANDKTEQDIGIADVMDETPISPSYPPVLTETKAHEFGLQKEDNPIPSIFSELEEVGNMENEIEKREDLMMKQIHNKGQ